MRLYRSRTDKKIFGVCGGLARELNVDATLLRLVVVVTAVFSGGTAILIYVLASMVIPPEPLPDWPASPYHPPVLPVPPGPMSSPRPPASDLDARMKEIETKALKREIEELRAKLAKYEKGDE